MTTRKRNSAMNDRIEAPENPFSGIPMNLSAEQSTLGGMLIDSTTIAEVVGLLTAGDFFRASHASIFETIRTIWMSGHGVDAITVAEKLKTFDGIEEEIDAILDQTPHAANTRFYAGIVKEKAVSRKLLSSLQECVDKIKNDDMSAEDLLAMATKSVMDASGSITNERIVNLSESAERAMARIDARRDHQQTGISYGFEALDFMTDGMHSDQLIVLAARPSMGKSAFACQVAFNVAKMNPENGVLIISLEMSAIDIAERLLCLNSDIPYHRIRGRMNSEEYEAINESYATVWATQNIFIDETPNRSLMQIVSTVRRYKAMHNIGLVVLDYMQLIQPGAEDKASRSNRQEFVSNVSRTLKTVARECSIPLIALSQLNRDVEKREDKSPKLSDLRESGAIEQDADVVLMLWRPEYYDANDRPGIAEMIIAKQRNGQCGQVPLSWEGVHMRFGDMPDESFNVGVGSGF